MKMLNNHCALARRYGKSGFTLIELLMVIMLIGILTLIGIQQFNNFSKDAKDAATKANLQTLRRGIAAQNGQMRVRCGVISNSYPPLTSLQANDITGGAGALCTTTQVSGTQDRKFVTNSIPANPWGSSQTNVIAQCSGAGCTNICGRKCDGTGARDGTEDGWCYDADTGAIWANTNRNDGIGTTGTECAF